jgi:hypothetical protein
MLVYVAPRPRPVAVSTAPRTVHTLYKRGRTLVLPLTIIDLHGSRDVTSSVSTSTAPMEPSAHVAIVLWSSVASGLGEARACASQIVIWLITSGNSPIVVGAPQGEKIRYCNN